MSEKLPLTFDAAGLVPVVVQDYLSGEIRMLAYASVEAIHKTMETGRATFWSRSRGELWEKGQTSGNEIVVKRILVDCDADALVYLADPHGPSCHTDAPSCFFQVLAVGGLTQKAEQPQTTLARLEETLEARKASTAAKSYTKSLLDGGAPAIGAKLREEAGELAEALDHETIDRVASEAADVVFHLMVGLQHRGVPWRDVLAKLEERASSGMSGHVEKASRV